MSVLGLSPNDLLARIADGHAPTILDVRSRWEFARGHVPGAIHVPFWRLKGRVAEIGRLNAAPTTAPSIPDGRELPVVVYCGHGPRAWYAAMELRRLGFTHVSCLKGHMFRWRREERPVEQEFRGRGTGT
jgi:rhodanese-related sulfurtransferase